MLIMQSLSSSETSWICVELLNIIAVGKDVESIDDSIIVRFLQALAVPIIGGACHVFMHGLNYVQVFESIKLNIPLQNFDPI